MSRRFPRSGAAWVFALALGWQPDACTAAPPPDPVAIIRQLAGELDLQTKLPVDHTIEVDSEFKLRIPGAEIILWLALAFAVVFVLYALRDSIPGFARRDRTKVEAEQTVAVEAAERMVQTGDDADDMVRLGRIAEAMHLLLLRSLAELRRSLDITLADSLTSREILHRVALPEDGREALGDLIRRVEFVHFGAKPAALADYEACRDSYERLIAAMLARPSAMGAA